MAVCGRCWICGDKLDCGNRKNCEDCASDESMPTRAGDNIICRECVDDINRGAMGLAISAVRTIANGGS